jgi:ATP/maltotriose-dependent transcriptional regulator MalT
MQRVNDWQVRRPTLVRAIDSALARDDRDRVASLLDDYVVALSLSAPDMVDLICQQAPHPSLAKHPRYLMAAAISRAGMRPFGIVDANVERLFVRWVKDQQSPAPRDLLLVKLAAIHRHLASGRLGLANEVTDAVQDLVRTTGDHEGFDELLPAVLIRSGIVRLLSGSFGDAIGSFSEAWRWGRSTDHSVAPIAAAHCALAHALAGDYVQAAVWRKRSTNAPTRTAGAQTLWFSDAAGLTDALLAIGCLDRIRALEAVGPLEVGIESGEFWWVGVHVRGRAALFWGDRPRAIREMEAELRAFPSLTAPSSLAGITLRAGLADLHQAEGDLDSAEKTLAELGAENPHPTAVGTLARQSTLRGDARKALGILDAARVSPLLHCGPPAQWFVLRANLTQTTSADEENALIAQARGCMLHMGAFDAAVEANPAIRPVLLAGLDASSVPCVPFVRDVVRLTTREREILDALAETSSVKDIAATLFVSHNTAKSHLRRIYRKLGVENRAQALRVSRKQF